MGKEDVGSVQHKPRLEHEEVHGDRTKVRQDAYTVVCR